MSEELSNKVLPLDGDRSSAELAELGPLSGQCTRVAVQHTTTSQTAGSTAEKVGIRRYPSYRDFKQLVLQRIPERIFKRSSQSDIFSPVSSPPIPIYVPPPLTKTDEPKLPTEDNMKSRSGEIVDSVRVDQTSFSSSPHNRNHDTSNINMDWAPDLSPVAFSPTLSVEVTPLSQPIALQSPPSRSRNFSSFRRKLSLRSVSSLQSIDPTRATSVSRQPTQNRPQTSPTRGHERRKSKYLNDPTVLSLLDRKFEEALELGFNSPPETPDHTQFPSPNLESKRDSPLISVDGTTIVEEEEEDDFFSRPTPNLTLPTLKELDDSKERNGDVMTLRLTLTPATCLTEVEENLTVESNTGLGKRMSGLGGIFGLGRTRSRKIKF